MDKRKIIYDIIYNKKVHHKLIYSFLIENDIKYTENNNGYFFNLSKLDDKYVDLLYDIVSIHDISYIYDNFSYNQDNKYKKLVLSDIIDNQIIEMSKNLI